ncbi:MAG: TolC family outer membrane protein [Wenzhouxiangella sp.]|jgi:adhesin transport system outer membrane protein|nr:TolC family outer membrane protein [Wenzhouxiangella sp.]
MRHKKSSHPAFAFGRRLILGCFCLGLSTGNALAQITIEDAVRTALETNPDVQARWHDFQSAGYATEAARGGYRPQIGIDASYGREMDNYITRDPMNTGFAEISVTQMLWSGGRVSANVAEFSDIELVRYFELLDTAEQTAQEAMRAYLDVLRFRQLVALAEENLLTHREVYDQVAESAAAGVARSADLEQISGRLALAESNLLNELANLHDVSARYLRVVGQLPPPQMADVDMQPDTELPDNVIDALMQAYRNNPRYHAALRNIEASESASRAQRAERMPRLNLTAGYGIRTRDELGFRDEFTSGRIGLELTYDLYTGGRNSANVRRAAELEGTAIALRDRACVDIRQDLQIAFNDYLKIDQQLPVLNQHRLSSDRVRTAYRQQFDIGQRTLLDVLDSENEFFEASRAWTNAAVDEMVAAARTLGAMGTLLETLGVQRQDIPSLDELGAEPMEIDPTTTCPLPPGAQALMTRRAEIPTPAPVTVTQVTLAAQTTFELDSAQLRPEARETLTDLAAVIREGRLVGQIEVVGHTCDLGSTAYNQNLSERRAQSVVDYLRSIGIGADEITAAGRGESAPSFPNNNEENRSRNRRVEITFVTEQETVTSQIPSSPNGPITDVRQVKKLTQYPAVGSVQIPAVLNTMAREVLAQNDSSQPLASDMPAQDY